MLLYAMIPAIGCALWGCEIAAPMIVGNVYLNKTRANIIVTENENDAKGCRFIKQVKASSSWGGLLFQDKALEKTISDLSHESLEAGANLLVLRSKYKGFGGSNSRGDAYLCPLIENVSAPSEEQPREAEEQGKEQKGPQGKDRGQTLLTDNDEQGKSQ